MKKIFLLLFIFSRLPLFAMSPKQEYFVIKNNLANELCINAEFLEKHSKNRWQQKIQGIDILITDYFKIFEDDGKIQPESKRTIISYYPISNDHFPLYRSRLWEMPLEVKLKDIFKTFTVMDSDGNIYITLETIAQVPLTIDGDKIILEIYDTALKSESAEGVP